MHHSVTDRQTAIESLCVRMGVKRLEVFGSAARNDFDEARSDVDFLVEFSPDSAALNQAPLRTWFEFKDGLEALLERPVDLVSFASVENPFVRASIERNRQLIYAA